MANGEIIAEVRQMLEGKNEITTKSALRLILALQAQFYEDFDEVKKMVKDHEAKLCEVEKSSIVIWIEKHPKAAAGILAGAWFVSTLLDPRDLFLKLWTFLHL